MNLYAPRPDTALQRIERKLDRLAMLAAINAGLNITIIALLLQLG